MVVAECALDEAHRRERESEARSVQRRLAIHVGHSELERRRQPRALLVALEHAACVQRKLLARSRTRAAAKAQQYTHIRWTHLLEQ